MEQRKLGAHGLEVSALGLGCMGMSFAHSGRAAVDLHLSPSNPERLEAAAPRGAASGGRYLEAMLSLLDR